MNKNIYILLFSSMVLFPSCTQNNVRVVNRYSNKIESFDVSDVSFGGVRYGDTTIRKELGDGYHKIDINGSNVGEIYLRANSVFLFSTNTDWTLTLESDGELTVSND